MPFYPFSDGDTFSTCRGHLQKALQEIDNLPNEYVLKASATELESHFTDKAQITPLQLGEPYIDNQRGVDIDVSRDFNRVAFPGHRIQVRGTQVTVAAPFDGDPALWRVRPSHFSLSGGYPEIDVGHGTVVFHLTFPDDSAQASQLKERLDRMLESLQGTVANLRRDVDNHNASVAAQVKDRIAAKLQKARAATGVVAALGIPMKRRDQPATYIAPTRRRDSPVGRPAVPTEKFVAEPTLDEKEYQHILSVMRSMSVVIERNRESFRGMDEQAIRDHFLLQLNGHYEGGATGETFNGVGKTDILIRVQNRNIFIAECKFWDGPKRFGEALEQLLSYLTWRDCKCALLVFNRTKDSAAVRQKMHDAMTTRPEHRKTVVHNSDGDSRYILVKATEPGKEIIVTTQLYDVPEREQKVAE